MLDKIRKYFFNLLIGFDQMINTILGGDPDETISSRLGKWYRAGTAHKGLKSIIYRIANCVVEMFEKDHFKKSIEEDEGDQATLE